MKKSLTEIYALAVCVATVICFAVTLGVAIFDIVQIAAPQITMSSYEYKRHLSNEAFNDPPRSRTSSKGGESLSKLQEDEITKRRQEGYQLALASERYDGRRGLIQAVIILLVSALFYFSHWMLAKRCRESSASV